MAYQLKKGMFFGGRKRRPRELDFLIAVAFIITLMLEVRAFAAEIAWEADVHAAAAPPVYHNGVVIIASADKHLRAFDAGSGDKLWDARFKAPLTFSPAAADGRAYITVLHPVSKLFCFDAVNGKKLWSVNVSDHATAPAAVPSGVIVGSGDFVVLYGPDGTLVNKVKTDTAVDAVYGVSAGILVIYVTGEIVLYSDGLGDIIARADLGAGRSYPLPLDYGILFARYEGEAVMTDHNFDVVWRADLPGRVTSPPVMRGDDYVVSCLGGGLVYISDSGVIETYTPLGSNVHGSPVVIDGNVYALMETGVIYVLRDDGVAEEFDGLEFKTSGGLVLFDGKLWAADDEGKARVYFVDGD
jgi:outer membrane protein assembly factor BamB